VAPLGAGATLRIEEVKDPGVASGRAVLKLKLVSITVNNQRFAVESGDLVSASGSQLKTAATDVGIGAAAGAGVGAAAAGGVGAAVGAGIGAAGGVIAAVTHKQRVKVPAETRLTFTLTQPASLPVGFASNPTPQPGPPAPQVEAPIQSSPSKVVGATQQLPKQEQTEDGIRVELQGCHRSASKSMACEITVEALTKDMTLSLNAGFYNDLSFIVDDKGLQEKAVKVTLGSTSNDSSAATYVVQSVPVQGKIEFGAVGPGIDELAILNLLIVSEGHEHKFIYRHIPLLSR
jgi:hypothetical protein